MKLNLDSLKTEIESYVQQAGFILFYGFSRKLDDVVEVEWDTRRYPDYKAFLRVAQELGVKLVIFHHHEFSSTVIERALEELSDSGLDYEDQSAVEQRLNELRVYEGFTCNIELSFDYLETRYMFELNTEWNTELNRLLDEIELAVSDDEDDEEGPLGGYYSKN
ncbi:MAG: hypothetical protein ACRD7E_12400 [Bryobacteraceae bacterium]